MKEEDLEASIKENELQLQQIERLWLVASDDDKAALDQVKNDLKDLINVLQDSLLSLKKSNLLKSLSSSEQSVAPCSSAEVIVTTAAVESSGNPSLDDVFGLKCRVPYTQEWGVMQYHNAMMLCKEPEPLRPGLHEKIRVLFMNPTHITMLPCPHFLEGNCRFTEDDCKFSHGHVVGIDEMEDYKEPAFSTLHCGSACLAKEEDGIWHQATVVETEELRITVSFDTHNKEATLPAEEVLPVECNGSSSDSVSSDCSDNEAVDSPASSSTAISELTWRPSSSANAPLGEWEQHTTGFGSRMMAKMGYVVGQGLGKNGHGRREPVEICILPPGKSLDAIAELREKGKIRNPIKRKKKRLSAALTGSRSSSHKNAANESAIDVFDFINGKISASSQQGMSSSPKETCSIAASYQELKDNKHFKANGKSAAKKDSASARKQWGIELVRCHEQISGLRKRLRKHKEALTRNTGRDASMVTRLTHAISTTESEIRTAEEKEASIQRKLHHTAQHKKLSVF